MMSKKIIISAILFFILILLIVCSFLWTDSQNLTFKINEKFNENIPVLVDNEPVFKRENNIIIPITMTTVRPVSITVGNKTKKTKVKKLLKTEFIPVKVVFKDKTITYNIQSLPQMFPDFSVDNKTNQKGYVLTSLFGDLNRDPSYSFVLDMDGNIVYYRGNTIPNRSLFHLKKFTLPDGKIRYATHSQIDEKERIMWSRGYYIVLDDKFNVLDRVKLLKTDRHDEMYADEHDFIILGDKHYITYAIYNKEVTLPSGEVVNAVHNVIQEQKNGKVVFEWLGEDNLFLLESSFEKYLHYVFRNPDYLHINSLYIDPKDDNLIASSAGGSFVMKINRKTADIMWILGGNNDQFNISKDLTFLRQHDAKKLPDDRLVLFDNQYSCPRQLMEKYSLSEDACVCKEARVLIFDLDEKNKKILSSEVIPLGLSTDFMGSVQYLDKNRWLIGCGHSYACFAKMTDNDGNILWKMNSNKYHKMYKAYYYKYLNK